MSMNRNVFSLQAELSGKIIEIPEPDEVSLFICGYDISAERGKAVKRGEPLAAHPRPNGGAANAPIAGKVSKIDFAYLSIKVDKKTEDADPVDVRSLRPGVELNQTMRDLGISVERFHEAETLIVNGLNPQPGINIAEQLLRDENETLRRGLSLVRKAVTPRQCVLVTGNGDYSLEGCTSLHVKPVYPNSLPQLVAKAVTGSENSGDAVVFSVHKLWQVGRVVETGRAIDETVFTLAGAAYRARIGTPIVDILDFAGVGIHPGDRLVLSGPLTGYTVFNVDHGLEKGVYALNVIPKDAFPSMEDRPCINCGECVLHCPARLQPNLLSRFAEYGLFERARENGLDACMECGLCSYWCPALRPMQHYLRFAKQQLRTDKDRLTAGWTR
ncbi:MAG: 4Fe-4S dicluster domain-containing protein [Desulfovibrio sp.]